MAGKGGISNVSGREFWLSVVKAGVAVLYLKQRKRSSLRHEIDSFYDLTIRLKKRIFSSTKDTPFL